MLILEILIVLISLVGLFISYKIKQEKNKKLSGGQMVCFPGHDCDRVVFSDYSKFFGISLEIMGFIYYSLATIFYLIAIFVPSLINSITLFIVLGLTFGGFLFSIYLTFIQVFKLKSYCTWCLGSAAVSVLIFILSIFLVKESAAEFLAFIKTMENFIRSIEFISLSIGLSIVTIVEIVTIRFLGKFKISEQEINSLKILDQINWFVLFGFIISNLGLVLIEKNPPYLLVESILVSTIIINLLIANIKTVSSLKYYRQNTNTIPVKKVCQLRKIVFGQSVISLTSWYFLFYINFIIGEAVIRNQEIIRNYLLIIALITILVQISALIFDKTTRQKSTLKR